MDWLPVITASAAAVVLLLVLGACIGVAGVALVAYLSRRDDFEDGYRTGWVDASQRMPLDEPADPREPQRTH
jgi:hypothetical protein